MQMKTFQQYIFLMVGTVAMLFAACSDYKDELAGNASGPHTYVMNLDGEVDDYEGITRGGDFSWPDGAKVFILFDTKSAVIPGEAVYSLDQETWTVTTTRTLPADQDGFCRVSYFKDGSLLSGNVSLTSSTASYQAEDGTYQVFSDDNLVVVNASLKPITARLRLTGEAGRSFAIGGMKFYSLYNVADGTLTETKEKISGKLDANGSSDFFYVTFADTTRRMVVDADGKMAFARQFSSQDVLAIGGSGYLTLPTVANPGSWQIVNADNLENMTLPEVSATELVTVDYKSASLKATATSGNGTVSEAGFVYSTSAHPTTSGNKAKSASVTSLAATIDVAGETTYYVRAYAINELGTSYGEEVSFTTPRFTLNDAVIQSCSENLEFKITDCVISGNTVTYGFSVTNVSSSSVNLQLSGSYYNSYAYDDQGNYYQTGIECSFSNQEFSQYSSSLTLPVGIMTKGRIRIKDVATDAASFPIVVLKTNQSSSLSFSNLAILGRTAVALPEPSVTCQVTSCADGLWTSPS